MYDGFSSKKLNLYQKWPRVTQKKNLSHEASTSHKRGQMGPYVPLCHSSLEAFHPQHAPGPGNVDLVFLAGFGVKCAHFVTERTFHILETPKTS